MNLDYIDASSSGHSDSNLISLLLPLSRWDSGEQTQFKTESLELFHARGIEYLKQKIINLDRGDSYIAFPMPNVEERCSVRILQLVTYISSREIIDIECVVSLANSVSVL